MLFSTNQEKNCSLFLPLLALMEHDLLPVTRGVCVLTALCVMLIQFISSCCCSGHSLTWPLRLSQAVLCVRGCRSLACQTVARQPSAPRFSSSLRFGTTQTVAAPLNGFLAPASSTLLLLWRGGCCPPPEPLALDKEPWRGGCGGTQDICDLTSGLG